MPFSKRELFTGLILFLLITLVVAGVRWSRLYNSQAISSETPVHIYLDEPIKLDSLTEMLADSGLVQSSTEFRWAAHIFGWRNFQKGHYLVDQGFKYNEFLSKIARGIQDPVSVTILPGRTKEDIVQRVSDQLQLDSLSFYQTLTDTAFLKSQNLRPEETLGRLYPNTYSVYWTTSPRSFMKRILEEFDHAVVTQHKQQFENSDHSINEILTLASIVEWEARNEQEKEIISGLYWNRLNNGMRLQADPTINFAVGERRRLLYEDYKIDHPYNTYINDGLPPGPITNPSLSSIKAALNPEEHDYLYMVASPDGTHSFSETFEEHKRKSAKWRKWLQKQYQIKRMREQNSE